MDDRRLLSPREVAAYVGYSVRTISRWRSLGLLDPLGLSHRPRYRRCDVDDLLRELANTVAVPSVPPRSATSGEYITR